MFTAAGVTGLVSKNSEIFGLKGWRVLVTNSVSEPHGESLQTRTVRLNREMPTAIVRTRLPTHATVLRPELHEAVTLITVERLVELLSFWHEHHRKDQE